MNLGQRIKQASKKSLYLTDSFITLRFLCQELAHLGPTRIKYKLELNHVIRVTVKKTRFRDRGNQIHLPPRHLDVLTVYSSCKLKTRQDEDKESSFLCGSITLNKKWPRTGTGLELGPYCTFCRAFCHGLSFFGFSYNKI